MAAEQPIQQLEQWVAPGVCLLARTEVANRGLIGQIANRLMSPSGIWLYVHQNQAALIDAPFAWEDASPAIELIADFLHGNQIQLKYVTASHLHLDHSAGLTAALDYFTEAKFVYPEQWQAHWNTTCFDRIKYGVQSTMSRQWDRDPHKSYENRFTTDLAGEPLHFMEAPYHSLTDQLVIFRGVAILPDWHLPTTLDEPLQLAVSYTHLTLPTKA